MSSPDARTRCKVWPRASESARAHAKPLAPLPNVPAVVADELVNAWGRTYYRRSAAAWPRRGTRDSLTLSILLVSPNVPGRERTDSR